MIRAALLAALALAGAGPATAQQPDRPPLAPTRDAIVGYHLMPATGEAIDVRVAFRSGGRAMRMDLPDQTYMLASPPAKTLVMVVPLERTALDLPWSDGPQPLFLLDDRMKFTRKADATIAGQRCTVWEAALDRARPLVCVTADGIILRNVSTDPLGRRNLVEAFIIRYEPIAEVDYTVPPNFERLQSTPREAPK